MQLAHLESVFITDLIIVFRNKNNDKHFSFSLMTARTSHVSMQQQIFL